MRHSRRTGSGNQGESQSQSAQRQGQSETEARASGNEYRQSGTQPSEPRQQYQSGAQYREPTTQSRQSATQVREPATQDREPGAGYSRSATGYREPEPPRKRPAWHWALVGLVGLIALGGIIAAIVTTTGSSSTPSSSRGAPVGTSFLTRDGFGDTYRVRLDRLVNPARGANTTPAAGNRLVGAVYTITGVSGSPRNESVISNASLLGSDGHVYRAYNARIQGYGTFGNGTISVPRGGNITGAATYQVPNGARLTQAQWAADGGSGQINRWALP